MHRQEGHHTGSVPVPGHAAAAWAVLAVWPFSRLVHAWSYPVWYLWRPFIVYRSRVADRPHEPGTSGRRSRRIGVRY
ncbi:MAG TPA: respiratory nitrate reductase subunit gamma [Acidimicrobiales bacterium]|nr:respiratory nitrate reductase subunit gamma [Acidimicrobiales bacterium]